MGNVFSDFISAICQVILPPCVDCAVGKVAYISQLEDNVNSLRNELEKLIEARDDVMRRVNLAEQRQMQRLNQVQGWLSRVEAEKSEVDDLIRNSSQEIEKLCLGGYCSRNCKSSYKLGKKVGKKLRSVTTLKSEGDFQVVAEKVREAAVVERPIGPSIVGLQSTFDRVWKFIGERKEGIIGIYGTGGVGKTTLLKQINNRFCSEPQDLDVVIWVVVSRELNVEKIQEDIGKRIGLFDELWKNKSLQEKAQSIFTALSKKKFVLLLDDIWQRIDLEEVGIPIPSPEFTSIVVFTTRSLDVCGKMKAKKPFRVECLRHEEAWKLFEDNLQSDVLDSHPEIPELAKTVAKECAGLPLALLTVSRAMSCKRTPEEWKHAINVLKNSSYKFSGMGTEVYPLLKFSYDSLPDETIKSCLLYCSLFPEDWKISKIDLIDCWIGEDFLDESNGNDVYHGYEIIGVLVRACLLEEEGPDVVKMHDVIRDMVLWITEDKENMKENFYVKAGIGLNEVPEVGKWEGVKRMSLMGNKIEKLLETPSCPNLQTLFLNDNRLKVSENGFFHFMHSLKVLNLSNNFILFKLLFEISNLVTLQYLNLSSIWSIKELPIEFKTLVNLKYLNLENTFYMNTIPCQLITNFSKLRVLKMYHCGPASASDVPKGGILSGGGELLVGELVDLKYLNVLTITLKTSCAFQGLLNSAKLRNCTQSLGLCGLDDSKWLDVSDLAYLKQLHNLDCVGCDNLEELKIGNLEKIKSQLPDYFRNLRSIEIWNCSKLRELTWLAFVPSLRSLLIGQCERMEEIISARKMGEVGETMANLNPFSKLQSLSLSDLSSLKCIYWKALPFPHLEEIVVTDCPELKKLPLDSNGAKERKIIIQGSEEWWKNLQWEDEDTLNAFRPCFQSRNY